MPSKPKLDKAGATSSDSQTASSTDTGSTDTGGEGSLDITNLNADRARVSNIGRLEPGDELLDDGSYFDVYSIDLQPGQEVVVSLVSSDFNTYVALISPDVDEFFELDELPDEANRSRISLSIPYAGTWYVMVTSVNPGETGNYLLSIKQ